MSDQSKMRALTEPTYWEQIWAASDLPRPFDPSDGSVRNSANMAFHRLFSEVLRAEPCEEGSLVELGCSQSKWLPYFRKEHKLLVAGIDYSPLGCARARLMLRREQCEGEIVEADIFNPPNNLRMRFDVVLSIGLVEHFTDTAAAVAACATFARPGGLVITIIPNLSGAIGAVQRNLDRGIYDKHSPLTREGLQEGHEKCGLSILRSEYMTPANFAIVNHPALRPPILSKLIRGVLVTITAAAWATDRFVVSLPVNQLLSSYVVCVARKS